MLCFVIILCIIVLLAILLYIPFYYDIEYKKDVVENRLEVKFRIFGFNIEVFPKKKIVTFSGKMEKKLSNKDDMSEFVKESLDVGLSEFIKAKSDIAEILDYMSRKTVFIKLLDVKLNFGFDDAAETGMFTGIFNAVIYNLLGFLHRHITVHKLVTDIVPDFNNKKLDMYVRCIIRLRTVNIIILFKKIFALNSKLKKED